MIRSSSGRKFFVEETVQLYKKPYVKLKFYIWLCLRFAVPSTKNVLHMALYKIVQFPQQGIYDPDDGLIMKGRNM